MRIRIRNTAFLPHFFYNCYHFCFYTSLYIAQYFNIFMYDANLKNFPAEKTLKVERAAPRVQFHAASNVDFVPIIAVDPDPHVSDPDLDPGQRQRIIYF
jgi:hypothetical protein